VKIVKSTGRLAPILVLYGAEGRGKTTLAAKFNKPLFFDLERGLPRGVSVDTVQSSFSFPTLMSAMREIHTGELGYETLVVDTIDSVEGLILSHVCAENRWSSIESPAFGKGWVAADAVWRKFLGALAAIRGKHGMTIVLVGHSTVERVEDPRAPSYTSYALRLHKRARALVMDAADIVGFLAEDLRIVTEDAGFNRERTRADAAPTRYLFVEGRPAFAAKNRFDMPSKIEIRKDFDITGLTKFFATPTAAKEVPNNG
jgi:hypothetical protein